MAIYNNVLPQILQQNHTNSIVVTAFNFIASGGLTFSGEANLNLVVINTGTGGITLSGNATNKLNIERTGSGTITLSGNATTLIKSLNVIGRGSIFLDGSLPDPIISIEGGLKLQGSSLIQSIYTYDASGTLTFGGAASCQPGYNYFGSGTMTFSNNALVKVGYLYQTSGGITLSGSADAAVTEYNGDGTITLGSSAIVVYSLSYTATGGMTFSGNATVRFRLFHTASGGINISGAADFIPFFTRIASGGIALSGNAIIRANYIYATPAQSMTFSGIAPFKVNYNYTSSGGMTLTGSAPVEFKLFHTASGGIVLSGNATAFIFEYKYIPTLGLIIGGKAITSFVVYDYFYDAIIDDSLVFSGSALVESCFATDLDLTEDDSIECNAGCNTRVGMLLARPNPRLLNQVSSKAVVNDAYVPAITVCNQKLWEKCPNNSTYKNDFQKKKCTRKIFNSKR